MRALIAFAAAVLGSIALFVATFTTVHRPLTVGHIPSLMHLQAAYASTLKPPRLVILAGSNGRYSHRCSVFTEVTALECVNLSVAFGIGLDFVLDQADPLLQPGDTVYMPLEFSQYRVSEAVMLAGAQNPLLVHDFRDRLLQLPLARIARAYGHFDLPFLFHGLIEMALQASGFQRRVNMDTVTPQGDEFGHDEREASRYREVLSLARFDTTPVPEQAHSIDVLRRFLQRQKERGVRVVGGWPTTPADSPMDDGSLERVRQLYRSTGHGFAELEAGSRYPRACFLDTLYHLHERCQLLHSHAVAQLLRDQGIRGPSVPAAAMDKAERR